jgi:hypothetical protein
MASKKLPPQKPVLNRRLLLVAALLGAFGLGLLVALLVPAAVVALLVLLLVVIVALVGETVHIWAKEQKAYLEQPVKRVRAKKSLPSNSIMMKKEGGTR